MASLFIASPYFQHANYICQDISVSYKAKIKTVLYIRIDSRPMFIENPKSFNHLCMCNHDLN